MFEVNGIAHELARHVRKGDLVHGTDGRLHEITTDYRRKATRLVAAPGGGGTIERIWTASIRDVKRGKKFVPVYVPAKLVAEAKRGKLPPVVAASAPKKPKASAPKGKGKAKPVVAAPSEAKAREVQGRSVEARMVTLETAIEMLVEAQNEILKRIEALSA